MHLVQLLDTTYTTVHIVLVGGNVMLFLYSRFIHFTSSLTKTQSGLSEPTQHYNK